MSLRPGSDGGEWPAEGAPEPARTALQDSQATRRRRILDEAHRLLAERGGANLQMRELAERADVALATAYRYFGSKDLLLAEVYLDWSAGHWEGMSAEAAVGSTNSERMGVLAVRAVEVWAADPQFLQLDALLRMSTDPQVAAVVHRVEEGATALVRGALRDIPDDDARVISLVVMAVVSQSLGAWILGRITLDDARRLVAQATTTVLEFRDPTL